MARLSAALLLLLVLSGCGWRSVSKGRQMYNCVDEQMQASTFMGAKRSDFATIEDYEWAVDVCTRLRAGDL